VPRVPGPGTFAIPPPRASHRRSTPLATFDAVPRDAVRSELLIDAISNSDKENLDAQAHRHCSGDLPIAGIHGRSRPSRALSRNVGGIGTVTRTPIGGGPVVTLASLQAEPNVVVLNTTSVLWLDYGTGTINSVPK
jgi:hypothetical protein